MISDQELEAILKVFDDRMQGVTKSYLQKIGEHLRAIGQMLPSDVHRLIEMKRMGVNIEHIQAEIARAMNASMADVESAFMTVAEADYRFAAKFYGEVKQVPLLKNKALMRILKAQYQQTVGELANLSQTTVVSSAYRTAIDKAVQAVQTGVADYGSAIRDTVRNVSQSGLRVQYESGLTRRLDSSTRMNVIDGARQLNQKIALQTGEEFGADGVEISAHTVCAEDHVAYQGKQYSMKAFERLQATLRRPIGQWNCRHFASPIILGISEPAYGAEQLKKFRDDSTQIVEIDGVKLTRYEWSQEQRRIETAIRYQNDTVILAKASGDSVLLQDTRRQIKLLDAAYGKVSKEAGLIPKRERMAVASVRGTRTAK